MVKREDLKKLESNDKRETWRSGCGESACDYGEFATNPRRNLSHLAITALSAALHVGKALNVPRVRNIKSSSIAALSAALHKVVEDNTRKSGSTYDYYGF